jgi:hypothetical protein
VLYKHFGLTAESVAKTVRQCIWAVLKRIKNKHWNRIYIEGVVHDNQSCY